MSALYIHIGMMKTGTTSLQRFFVLNRKTLRKNGVVYPEFPKSQYWVPDDINGYWLYENKEEVMEASFSKVNEILRKGRSVLLSAENLWDYAANKPEFWENVRSRLLEEAELKMIAYVRRQDDYLLSRWGQFIVSQNSPRGNYRTFAEYLEVYQKLGIHVDYGEYLDRLEPVIGRENMLIRPYEKGQWTDGNIYADFLDVVGLADHGEYAYPEQNKNPSLKGNILEAKRLLNHTPGFSDHGAYRNFKYIYRAEKHFEAEGQIREILLFPQKERELFLEKFAESNRYVAQKYLGREDGPLFFDTPPADVLKEGEYTIEDTAPVFGYMITELLDDQKKLRDERDQLRQERDELKREIESLRETGKFRRKFKGKA